MKNKKTIFGIIAIIAVIFTIIGCGGGGKLDGTYVSDRGSLSLTFSGNKLTVNENGSYDEGTYEIKNRLQPSKLRASQNVSVN